MRRLALTALVALAAGCGGEGGGGLSREEFVTELDRICADFNAKEEEIGEPETLAQIVEQGTTVRREFGAAIEEIRDLGEPPGEIRDDVNRFVEISDELHALLGDLIEAAEQEDVERLQEVAEEGEQLQEESDRLAEELGAERCAED